MSEVMKAWEIIGNEYRTDWRNIRNLCDNVYFGRNGKFPDVSPSLTDDQQVVLEWLQAYADKDSGDKPFQTLFYLWDCIKANRLGRVEMQALIRLSNEEQAQVLQAFASWALEQEEK